ncbi:MAG: VOC family protein [Prolixibacteraceae bacterium]|jgi:predicted 3-demethylubiquinone-9 3-methyltransferase (glyoxalase superfamily)|nr:VOC family protein [Prolixibacteraceae bacterium]
MTNQIYPCLWFESQAKAAAEYYCSIFNNSKIISESPVAVQFELEGNKVMGLNGGPMYKINPSISLFVTCETVEEIDRIWHWLSEGGSAMMPLDKYPWSEKYGWVVDKFGMTWQLMLGGLASDGQKIIPSILFVGEQFGQGQLAIRAYTEIFPNSGIRHLEVYPEGDDQLKGTLMFGSFDLNGSQFAAMDGPGTHDFQFCEGVSFVVECGTQEEIDSFWDKLSEGGNESQCGWLKDRFGISWQIIPSILGQLMSDPERGARVMQELLKMKKLDIEKLKNA